jgi:hypothetical protein
MIGDHYSVARGVSEVIDLMTEIAEQSSAKRRAEAELAPAVDQAKKPRHGSSAAKILLETWWDSSEAKKLFLGDSSDERDVVEVLEQRIERLQQVNRTADGWRDIVDRHDKDNLCSAFDVFIIRQRCSILCLAYINALEEMNVARWIEDCCAEACRDHSKIGIEAAGTNERTVARWNILLRGNREHFPLPNLKIQRQIKSLPDLLEYFQEEVTLPWIEYCIENLADLTVELAHNELFTMILPNALAQQNQSFEDGVDHEEGSRTDGGQKNDCLLQIYTDFPISQTTTWRWLRHVGFSYDSRKKSFFVDGHERPNVVFHRNEFCMQYLAKLEPRTYRWVQLTKQAAEQYKVEKKILDDDNHGYQYLSEEGFPMVEFHVDDHEFLHDVAEEMGFGLFGGNLSIRKSPDVRPLMIFGQDESAYSQFLFGNRQWVGPKGQRPLLPKTNGLSIMVSAFQSWETGFGVDIDRIQMDEINAARTGQCYADKEAAMAIKGQATKKDLTQSPFVVYFELGANNEGYWTYNHMAIQFEDCLDCLKVLYPHFDFAFLFDHSQVIQFEEIDCG